MFLALRELWFARGRFVLMGTVVALIALLMTLLSGLSVGLAQDGVSGLQRIPATSFAFEQGVSTDSAFSRSVVGDAQVAAWQAQPGVLSATPFGNTLANARTDRGLEIDFALFGVKRGSFLDPDVATGSRLGDGNEIVISRTAADAGITVGDTVILEPSGTELTVVGILADQHTFGHVDVGYVPLRVWQEVRAGMRPGDVVPAHVYEEFTAVAVEADPASPPDLAAGDAAAGTTSLTREQSFAASPGYSAETSTLSLIQVFLYGISALVIGAFFTVLTIQRRHEIAVLRAMGASSGYVLRDSLAQSAVLLVASTAVGMALGLAGGAAIESTPMPFALEAGPIAGAAVALVVTGLIGAAAAVVRVVRVDPLAALGAHR
jgi:putative ABC transport system permease protein